MHKILQPTQQRFLYFLTLRIQYKNQSLKLFPLNDAHNIFRLNFSTSSKILLGIFSLNSNTISLHLLSWQFFVLISVIMCNMLPAIHVSYKRCTYISHSIKLNVVSMWKLSRVLWSSSVQGNLVPDFVSLPPTDLRSSGSEQRHEAQNTEIEWLSC